MNSFVVKLIPVPVILHSLASPSTLAWIMYQKFVNALPLYHQKQSGECLVLN